MIYILWKGLFPAEFVWFQTGSLLHFLIENLPPQLHLIIASREDPQLSLARLRARGQLTEFRAGDLRFTASEAAEFLNQVMTLIQIRGQS